MRSRFFASIAALAPRSLSLLAALFVVWFALRADMEDQTPMGSLSIKVVVASTGKPAARARVYVSDGAGKSFLFRADKNGRVFAPRIPADGYHISANLKRTNGDEGVAVWEGERAEATVALKPSDPRMNLVQHIRVYASNEGAKVAVTGFVDAKKYPRKDDLKIRLYRTRVSQILNNSERIEAFRSYEWGQSAKPGTIPEAMLKPAGMAPPVKQWEKSFPIREDDIEGFFYERLDFGKLARGFYLMDVTHGTDREWSWLMVTDVAIVVKRVGSQMATFTVDMQTGKPLSNVALRTYFKNKRLSETVSDANGLSESAAEPSGEDATDEGGNANQLWIIAQHGDDEAIATQGFYGENMGAYRVHSYTDRPIYRPGQRIQFKGIARRLKPPYLDNKKPFANADDVAHPYTIPANQSVEVQVHDQQDETYFKETLKTNAYGAFSGSLTLADDAPTGVYTLVTNIGGETFTHDIVIASYQKPEFEAKVTSAKPYYLPGEQVEFTVSGNYYFGAPMAGTKVKWNVYTNDVWGSSHPLSEDDDVSEGQFDDRMEFARRYQPQEVSGLAVTNGEGFLDANGKLVLRFPAPAFKDPDSPPSQEYNLRVEIQPTGKDEPLFLDGKANVVAGETVLYLEPEGYAVSPNQPTNIVVIAQDQSGRPIPNLPITLECGREQPYKQDNGDMGWETRYKYNVAETLTATTNATGKAVISYTPKKSGDILLKARAKDGAGRGVLGRTNLWVVGKSGDNIDMEYSDLTLLTDKRSYAAGDTARVLINTDKIGQTVLLTVEGDRIYDKRVVAITSKSTVVEFPVRAEYGPNVELGACYVKGKRFSQSHTPLRVATAEHKINIAITPDRKGENGKLPRYQPGDNVTYKVKTTDGKGAPVPCEFSMALVDEAIYALREDAPGAIKENFYPQRYNRVQTFFSFAVEYLGDADKAEPQMTARKQFPDTLYWNPTLQTDAQGEAAITVPLKDNLTTWRATVVAHAADTRIGWKTEKILSAKDFLLRLEKPRFLTQFDRSQLTAIVHNDTGTAQTALVRMKAENLKVEGENTQRITLQPGEQKSVDWNVVAEQSGAAKLRVTAWTLGGARPYTDGIETPIPIEPHGREEFQTFSGELTAERAQAEVIRFDPRSAPDRTKLTLRLAPNLTGALLGSLDYITGYPYGCVEQTTSRYLADLMAQKALKGASPLKPEEVQKMVKAGVKRIFQMQNKEKGTWGWWSYDEPNLWMTAYALYGLAEAQAQGYAVPKQMLDRARTGVASLFDKPTKGNEDPDSTYHALMLHALAKLGDKALYDKYRPAIRLDGMSTEALANLFLADKRMGKEDKAITRLLDSRRITKRDMTFWESMPKTFSSDLATTATALRVLIARNPKDPNIASTLRWLMHRRTGAYWVSTRDTLAVLMALSDYLQNTAAFGATGEVVVRVNGKEFQRIAVSATATDELKIKVPLSALQPDKNDIALERVGGNSPVFYSLEMRQTVQTSELKEVFPKGFRIEREYLRVVSKQGRNSQWSLETEETGNQLKVGDNVRVRLTIYTPQELDHVLIEDPYPAGCSLSQRGTEEEVVSGWRYWWSHIDIRDQKIAFFARSMPAGKHVLEYNLRAKTPGAYKALPTFLQPMYAPDLHVETGGATVEVR